MIVQLVKVRLSRRVIAMALNSVSLAPQKALYNRLQPWNAAVWAVLREG